MPVWFALQKLFQGRLAFTYLVLQTDSDFSDAAITIEWGFINLATERVGIWWNYVKVCLYYDQILDQNLKSIFGL